MAKILIAAAAEQQPVLQRILAGHELCCATSMVDAVELLRQRHFDLILCTILFDDSRMFDLLNAAQAHPQWKAVPFVCVRLTPTPWNLARSLHIVAFTAEVLGATKFVDIRDYGADPEQQMRSEIERAIPAGH